ncbi:hypothetical protein [Rhodobacter sp. NSM]|uniref:hypothetical protein n=1 Tax=Rhodobacter sp. NSM TaxID=3457501 RepID=UPI003FD6349D
MQKYTVLRQHIGDRPYEPGDMREAAHADVAHLVPHVLEPIEADDLEPIKAYDGKADAKPAARGKKVAKE